MSNQSIVEFTRGLLRERKIDEIGISHVITPYAVQENITFEKSRDHLYKALDEGSLIMGSTFKVYMAETYHQKNRREEKLQQEVEKLTKENTHGNYVEASNRIYDLIKKRIPLARKVILKEMGLHDQTSDKKHTVKMRADITGTITGEHKWMSDLGKVTPKKIVQHRGGYATAYNFKGEEQFTIDLKLLVMSEEEFAHEVRKNCSISREKRDFLKYVEIEKHLHIAYDEIGRLKNIQKKFDKRY